MKSSIVQALAAAIFIASPALDAQAHDSPDHAMEASRVAAMRQATSAFLATLDEAQSAIVIADLQDNAVRTSWSNLPVSMAPRNGLSVADMSVEQRRAFHAMMAASLSSQGYLKTTTSIWHEDVLHQISADFLAAMPDDDPRKPHGLAIVENYDSEKFFVSVFGNPGDTNWGWTLTGHHYAVTFTVSDNKIAFTPMFLGANPQTVLEGRYAGWRILQHEADRAFALLASLETSQLEATIVSDAVDNNLFAGPGRQKGSEPPDGIKASDLNPIQKRLLHGLIDEYLSDASDEAATRQRAAIAEDGLDTLHFAWWGPTDNPTARFMYRVQGPSILIDYVRERSFDGAFNHVHSIVRDPSNDYGAEWLKRHYDEAHQN